MVVGLKPIDQGNNKVALSIFKDTDIAFRRTEVQIRMGFLVGCHGGRVQNVMGQIFYPSAVIQKIFCYFFILIFAGESQRMAKFPQQTRVIKMVLHQFNAVFEGRRCRLQTIDFTCKPGEPLIKMVVHGIRKCQGSHFFGGQVVGVADKRFLCLCRDHSKNQNSRQKETDFYF